MRNGQTNFWRNDSCVDIREEEIKIRTFRQAGQRKSGISGYSGSAIPSLSAISSSFIPDFCACLTRSLIWSALLLRGLRFFGVSTSFFLASSLAIFSLTAAILLSNSVADAAFLFSNSKMESFSFSIGHPNQQRFVPGFYGHVFLQTLSYTPNKYRLKITGSLNISQSNKSNKTNCVGR